MKKMLRKRKWKLIALQITFILCGAYLWYGNWTMFCDLRADFKDGVTEHHLVSENSGRSIGIDNRETTHEAMTAPVTSSNEEIILPSSTVEKKIVEMSAYTSRVEETDESPCISADGTNICEYDGCVVASNDYEFGTKIIVDGFGECEVKDRMNSRYTGTGNMDIYFRMDLEGALTFGRKQIKIEIAS